MLGIMIQNIMLYIIYDYKIILKLPFLIKIQ